MSQKVVDIESGSSQVRQFEERLVQRFRELLRKGYGSVKATVADGKPQHIEVVTTER